MNGSCAEYTQPPMKNLLRLIGSLIPTSCILCNRYQANTTCEQCLQLLGQQALNTTPCCPCCGLDLPITTGGKILVHDQHCSHCVAQLPYFDLSLSMARYEGLLKTAVHQLKYHRRLAYAMGLANLWNSLMKNSLMQLPPAYLLPVPLSRQKLRERGFNQCLEITRHLTLPKQLKLLPHALRRHHSNFSQISANRNDRQRALNGLFYFERRYIDRLAGQSVIVFDDVMTTGSTLNEIAKVLKSHGVSHVSNWVILRTPRQLVDV